MKGLVRLLDQQRDEQAALDERAQRRLLEIQKATLRDLEQRLRVARSRHEEDAFTVQLLLSLRAQLQALIAALTQQLDKELQGFSATAQKQGAADILAQVALLEGAPEIAVRNRLGLALAENARLRRPDVLQRYGADLVSRLEAELAVTALGQVSRFEAVERLIERSTRAFELSHWRAGLIFRNELSNAYDDAAKVSNETLGAELAQLTGDTLLTRMDEARDKRSHPFSLAAHGTVSEVGKPWRVPVLEVQRFAAARGSRAGGIVWPIIDGEYTGMGYIAHHNDRGRRTAWKQSWGDPRAA